jgi:hypothetical protein
MAVWSRWNSTSVPPAWVCCIKRLKAIWTGNLTGPRCAGLGADRKSSCQDRLPSLNATDPRRLVARLLPVDQEGAADWPSFTVRQELSPSVTVIHYAAGREAAVQQESVCEREGW